MCTVVLSSMQSEHIRRALGSFQKPVQVAQGHLQTAFAEMRFRLMDYVGLESQIQIPRKRMIPLVCGGIFSAGFSTTRRFNKMQCFLQQRQSFSAATSNLTTPRAKKR
jgi:hypothetical protein